MKTLHDGVRQMQTATSMQTGKLVSLNSVPVSLNYAPVSLFMASSQ